MIEAKRLARIAQLKENIGNAEAAYQRNLTKRGVPKNRRIADSCLITIRCDGRELERLS